MKSADRITRAKLRTWGACYSDAKLTKLVPERGGTPLQIARAAKVPEKDRIWVLTRTGACSERVQRLFAVRCARRALARVATPDTRSIAACDVAERFANGGATPEELAKAKTDAYAAADAVVAYATYATYATYAAYSAAYAAAYAAADGYAAYSAADAAERKAQIADLIDLLRSSRIAK